VVLKGKEKIKKIKKYMLISLSESQVMVDL
jgi:hypothetical protein